jgi:hypothetical protein
MKKIGIIALAPLAAAAAILAAGVSGPGRPDQVGYFKSTDRNRVMAYTATEDMSEAEARAFLADVMHTPGQLTFAVIYPPHALHPGPRLATASSYLTAAAMLDTAPHAGWSWGVVINPTGAARFDMR